MSKFLIKTLAASLLMLIAISPQMRADNYTPLNYIEANGIAYQNSFQSSYVANANTGVEIKFQYYQTGGGYYCVFSGRNGWWTGMSMYVHNNGVGYYMGGYHDDDQFTDFAANTDYVVTADFSSISVTGGVTESDQTGYTDNFTSATAPLELFANSAENGGYYNNVLNGRIYYFKINENGAQKYDFEPVMRHDGVYGYLDEASGTFLTTKTGSYTGYSPSYVDGNFYFTGLSASSINLTVGKSQTITPTYVGTAPSFSYSTSDASIATVDENGKISAIGEGTATITVTADPKDGYGEWALTCKVNVVDETLTTYTPLEYISANGINHNNSFQTSYTPNANTEVEVKFLTTKANGYYDCIFSGRTWHTRGMSMFLHGSAALGYYMGGYTNDNIVTGLSLNTEYTVSASLSTFSISGGKSSTISTGRTSYDSDSQPIELFTNTGQDESGYNSTYIGRIYYLKISESGTEKYDFEPVMRHDGVYGFYDANSNTFIQPKTGSYSGYSPGYIDGNFYLLGTDITVQIGKTANAITKVDGATYTYSVGDESIATIDDDGVVTGVGAGSTTLTIIASYNGETWKASPTITVIAPLTSNIGSFPVKTWKQGGAYACERLFASQSAIEDNESALSKADLALYETDGWANATGPFRSSSNQFNGEGSQWTDFGSNAILVRRMFSLTSDELADIKAKTVIIGICYDQFAKVLLNGTEIPNSSHATSSGTGAWGQAYDGKYEYITLSEEQKELLQVGNNVISMRVWQGGAPQFADLGIFTKDDEISVDDYTTTDGTVTGNGVITINGLTNYLNEQTAYSAINLADAEGLANDVTANAISTLINSTNVTVTVPSNSYITGQNIVNDGVCESLVLTDGSTFAPEAAFTATAATYSRTMTGYEWATICLPYAISSDGNVKVYKLNDDYNKDNTITVDEVETLDAGKPALIHKEVASATSVTLTGSGDVVTQPNNPSAGFIGYFTRTTVTAEDYPNAYYIYNNEFYRINQNFIVTPFRAFLNATNASSNSFSILVDDDPTGINGVSADDAAREIEGVYSVSGVKQSSLQKGINIVRYRNGKTQKVILK